MAHDVPNLGIIDGSTFVTSGGVNPTSSICALALRAVEHLIAHRGDVPTPTHRRSVDSCPVGPSAPARPAAAVTLGRPPDERDDGRRRRPTAAGPGRPGPDPGRRRHALGRRGGRVRCASRPGGGRRALPRRPRSPRCSHADIAEEDIGAWLDGLSAHDPAAVPLPRAGRGRRVLPRSRSAPEAGLRGTDPPAGPATAFPEYVDEGLLDAVLSNWAGSAGRVRTASPPRPGSG